MSSDYAALADAITRRNYKGVAPHSPTCGERCVCRKCVVVCDYCSTCQAGPTRIPLPACAFCVWTPEVKTSHAR